MATGLIFVRGQHYGDMFLPFADYPAEIYIRYLNLVAIKPELSQWVPDLHKRDFYLYCDGVEFLLLICGDQKLPQPTHHCDRTWLASFKTDKGIETICRPGEDVIDATETPLVRSLFRQLQAKPGPAIGGRYTTGQNAECKALKERVWDGGAQIVISWAEKAKAMSERGRVFMSHKGVNKPLVRAVSETLNMIGVKTWLDDEQMPAGQPVVRTLGKGVADCIAAVFFISDAFKDEKYIKHEIDWALDRVAADAEFRIIPLVLSDHGGTVEMVPEALRYLTWKTVSDVHVLGAIIVALPARLQERIGYVHPTS